MAMFDARAAAEALDQTPFEFVGMDGEAHVLPPFSALTLGHVRRISEGDMTVIGEVAGPETSAAIDDLPAPLFEQLCEAWAASAEEAGKSGSTSPARPTGAKQSRRTSRSVAST